MGKRWERYNDQNKFNVQIQCAYQKRKKRSVQVRTVSHGRHSSDIPRGKTSTDEFSSILKHCTAGTKQYIEQMGEKERENQCTKGKTKKKNNQKDPDLGERNKSVRTSIHGNHSSDIPCREITVEFTGIIKHCTAEVQRSNE